MQSLGFIGIIGIVLAVPALLYSIRLTLRVLLYLIFSKEKVIIRYHDEQGNISEKKIFLKKDDELLSLLDDIAKKNNHGDKSHG
ncbi:hypothetical protein [Providencia sp. PROV020]|uniref:hypothetical protein n=1 Tax=unclassified Providencia TaxID=2633465 RepID=UPI00234A48FC|nr:hypothetical protein [Providencia sp. PROV020]